MINIIFFITVFQFSLVSCYSKEESKQRTTENKASVQTYDNAKAFFGSDSTNTAGSQTNTNQCTEESNPCNLHAKICGWFYWVDMGSEILSQALPVGSCKVEGGIQSVFTALGWDHNVPLEENIRRTSLELVCTYIGCFPPANPLVIAAKCACVGGLGAYKTLRCSTLNSECESYKASFPPARGCPLPVTMSYCKGNQLIDRENDGDMNNITSQCARRIAHMENNGNLEKGHYANCLGECVNETFSLAEVEGATCSDIDAPPPSSSGHTPVNGATPVDGTGVAKPKSDSSPL